MILWFNYNVTDMVNAVKFYLVIISDATSESLPGDNKDLLNTVLVVVGFTLEARISGARVGQARCQFHAGRRQWLRNITHTVISIHSPDIFRPWDTIACCWDVTAGLLGVKR